MTRFTVLLLAALLATAGGPAAAEDSVPGAPVRPRITGTVAVPVHAPGPAYVLAATRLDALIAGHDVLVARVAEDGAFALDAPEPGAYYVAAFLDANGNAAFERSEPYVVWPERVSMDAVQTAQPIVLRNFLNLANPAVRTADRNARVAEQVAAAEAGFRDLLRADLPPAVDARTLLPTLRVSLAECARLWEHAADEATWQYVDGTLSAIPDWVAAAQRGEDPLAAQRGWVLRGFMREPDHGIIPYLVYVPPDYDAATPLPAVLGLHGGGGDHWSGARMVVSGDGMEAHGPDRPPGLGLRDPDVHMLIVTPTGDRSSSVVPWRGYGVVNAMGALAEVRRRYAVDPDRVYLTGMSDGGRGAWEIGVRYPDRFAAILIGAGAMQDALPFARNVAHIPIRVVHGTHDRIIPVQGARNAAAWGKQFGARIEYEEVDRGHDITDLLYANETGLQWLGQFRRSPVPPLVRFRTVSLQYNEGAGVVITAMGAPNQVSDIQVAWETPGRVHVDTRNVAGMTLRVPPGPPGPIGIVWNGHALHVAERAAGIHLAITQNAAGQVGWSAETAPAPVGIPPGTWSVEELG